jgi:mannosyltransferase OCH1-like enzyme
MWRTEVLPRALARYAETWRRRHPDWEYRLWTDATNRRFIAEHHPWFLEQYDGYRWPIQRVDAVRYFILYDLGGLYVDLDFECRKPIDPLLRGVRCALALEIEAHCREFGREKIISNAWMAAEPRHPFFAAVTQALPRFADPGESAQPVLETTGPFMLTDVYDAYSGSVAGDPAIELIPSRLLHPMSREEAARYRRTGETSANLRDVYAIHLHQGSWWNTWRFRLLAPLRAARRALGAGRELRE